MIKSSRLALLMIVFALPAMPVRPMDAGTYTIVDGDVRVLRGTTWSRLTVGTRIIEGDVIDVGERAQLQLELAGGGKLNAQGPALMHAASIPSADGKGAAVADLVFQQGWFKATAPGSRPVRVRMPMMTIAVGDAVVVVSSDARRTELFVESGTTNVALPRGKDGPPRDATAGEFVSRDDERAPVIASRPPPPFLAQMPRQFRDALPSLAGRFPVPPESLVKVREISFAEAEPWLTGTNRKSFVRRFTPRLNDPAFRAAVAAHPAQYPEWDRILHPEKYRPKETTDAK